MSRLPKIRSSSFVYSPVESTGEEEEWWTDEDEESEGNGSSSSQNTVVSKSKKKHYPPRPIDLIPGNTLPVEVKVDIDSNPFTFANLSSESYS